MEITKIPILGAIIRILQEILGYIPKEKLDRLSVEPAAMHVSGPAAPAAPAPATRPAPKPKEPKKAEPAQLAAEPKQESRLPSPPAQVLSDYEGRCKAILGESKTLDMVMVADGSGRILVKVEKQSPQSSIRRFSPEDVAKMSLRANITKGAFNVDAPATGRTSLLHIQYNAMDVLIYPLENDLSLIAVGMVDPAAMPETSLSMTNRFPTKVKMAMVVDDEQDILTSVRHVLMLRGFQVETAASGPEALAIIEKAQEKGLEYGMAILDIRMPGMDGIELFKRIRQASPNTKMIFITAFEYSPEEVGKMVSAGNVTVLRKPFKRSDLLQAIISEQN